MAEGTTMNGESISPSIPLIDFTPFLDSSAPSNSSIASIRLQTATNLLQALKTSGFLYLRCPIPTPQTLYSIYAHSTWFFALPQSTKSSIPWDRPESNRGYSGIGLEKVSVSLEKDGVGKEREEAPDLKESLEIGREGVDGMPNRWPTVQGEERRVAVFRREMMAFFEECKSLHRQLMRALAVGLFGSLEHEKFFDEYTAVGDNTLRLLHYPEVKKSVFRAKKGQVRAGAHTDYGSVTLLFQDQRGGLQVSDPVRGWVDVRPIEGTIVVNAGDLLTRWSNGLIRSTLHRVVEPAGDSVENRRGDEEDERYPARYSIAYFCNPDFEKTIDAIPGTVEPEMEKRFEKVNSGEYLARRLAATY